MAQQLALYRGSFLKQVVPVERRAEPVDAVARQRQPRHDRQQYARAHERKLCAGCRAKEARYGFRSGEEAAPADRPRTLCFDCFRMELGYRQAVALRMANGWNGTQSALPLAEAVAGADRRRRRAQIAARHALELR